MQEEYYPRGGTKPKLVNDVIKSENLFNTLHKKEKKKKRHSNQNKKDTLEKTEDTNFHLTCAELLSYEKILSGMVVLGCVRDISSYTIEVELPGRTFARIEINAISDILSRTLLEKAENSSEAYIEENVLNILSKIFTCRQFLPVFVLDVTEAEDGSRRIMGSVNPKHINGNLKYKTFKKGMLVWGCIAEKSDHVYIIDTGVKNTRVILPFKNCDNRTFVEGETSWFIVKESRIQDNTSTITVSTNGMQSVLEDGNIDQLLPGVCVEFQVTKILKDGLEGTYFNNCIGYVNQTYLEHPMDSLQKYKDVIVKAYILYIHPTTKFAYLTLRNTYSPSNDPTLSNGYIGPAKIMQNVGKGVIVKLKKNELGLVTYKRLIRSLKLRDSSNLFELVKRKFPIGSTHQCRILDYITMDNMYICSFEQNVLKETIFSKNDLKLGQLVNGVVEGINTSGITIKIGKLLGFVTNEHISNVQYSENMKRNYRIGDSVVARVWDLSGSGIKLTLKPIFVQDDNCLTSYELAKKNAEYKGMVVKTYDKGVLVCFYGGVKGWLKLDNSQQDIKNLFYQGQVINAAVSFVGNSKLFLTLDSPEKLNHRKLQIGQFTSGIVQSVNDEGILVRTAHNNQGFIPTNHLSVNIKLSNIMLNLFDVDDEIENLICIGKDKRRIVSLREYNYYKSNNFYIPKHAQLKPGLILRSSMKSFDKKQLLLTSPILFCDGVIVVDKEDIMEDGETLEDISFTEGQAVIAKLTTVDDNQIKATVKLSEVYNYDYKYPVDLLTHYLNDVEVIQKKLKTRGDPLAQYKIGQRITCQIKKINNIGCSVNVGDEIQGIVAPEHWPNKPRIGSLYEGIVLYINFTDKYLGISLNNHINQKIDNVQGNVKNITIGQTLYAKILLIRPEFVLCSLGKQGNKQIGYMPTILHENDFKPNYGYYRDLNGTFKFIVTGIVNEKIIGLEKILKQTLELNHRTRASKKRKHSKDGHEINGYIEDSNRPKRRKLSSDKHPDVVSDFSHKQNGINTSEKSVDGATTSENDSQHSEIEDSADSTKLEEGDDTIEGNQKETDSDSEEEIQQDDPQTSEGQNGEINSLADNNKSSTDLDQVSTDEENEDYNPPEKSEKRRVSFCEYVEKFVFSDEHDKKSFVPPSVTTFFDSDDENAENSASSDEEALGEDSRTKKKKLTRAEQAELLRQQEEELRRKELEFAEPTTAPQNAEQFDRRLLAEPNSSKLWTQYISFHLASTEIDKARAVIKRALQTIDLKAEQDRLNVWIASMNLENYYGTKETFANVFNEAVRCNDDFTIYMQAIKILSSSLDNSSLDDYVKKARAKFKQNPKMYTEIGKVYYAQKRFVEARKLKDAALKTITNMAEHIPLIVKFAIMEFNDGEDYQAEALFETILQSNPKRVDVWSTYVDQLVKKNKIDIARRVLERAVTQKLNIKKMKCLHKKFYEFEQIYGNDETRAEQKRLLENYTKQFVN